MILAVLDLEKRPSTKTDKRIWFIAILIWEQKITSRKIDIYAFPRHPNLKTTKYFQMSYPE